MKRDFCRELISAWYELLLVDESTLCLRVRPSVLEYMKRIDWSKSPGVEHMKRRFGFSTFTPPRDGSCGF
jgi:hypothetical protein